MFWHCNTTYCATKITALPVFLKQKVKFQNELMLLRGRRPMDTIAGEQNELIRAEIDSLREENEYLKAQIRNRYYRNAL